MNFAAYKAAISTWVEAQSGLTAQWRDEPGGWQSKPRVRLHLKDSGSVGVDWLSWDLDGGLDTGADFVPSVNGNRALVLTMICETRDQTGNDTASYYLEKLRTSLLKPSAKAALLAGGLVATSTERVIDLPATVDDRIESRANLDVMLSAVVQDRDEGEADSYADHYTVAGTFTTPAGDDLGGDEEELP